MSEGTMQYEHPTVIDHGTIAEHTFSRCGGDTSPPKDWQDFPLDKFGECSDGHAS